MIRFIEIPRASLAVDEKGPDMPSQQAQIPAGAAGVPEGERVMVTPPPAPIAKPSEKEGALEHLDPDAELLRRIREA